LYDHFTNQNRLLKGTGVKRDVYPSCSTSTRAEFLVAPAESAPLQLALSLETNVIADNDRGGNKNRVSA